MTSLSDAYPQKSRYRVSSLRPGQKAKGPRLTAGLWCVVAAARYMPLPAPVSEADLFEIVPWLPKQYDPIWKFSHVSNPNV